MAKKAKSENIFEKARKNAPTTEEKQTKAVEINDLHLLTSLGIVITAVQTLYATVEGKVKGIVADKFIELGTASKHQPKNFEGVDGDARASCQLRKRVSRSALTEEQVAFCTKHGISTQEEVKQEEKYAVNEKYHEDQATLEKASKCLVKAGLPEDFIVLQPKIATMGTTKTSIEEVFAKVPNRDDIRVLLDIVSTLALGLKLEGGDVREAIKTVTKILESE